MLEEQSIAALGAHTGLFPGPQAALALASSMAGNTAGRLWVAAGAEAGLLWDKGNNVLYFGGALDEAAAAQFGALVAGQLREQAYAEGRPYVSVHPLTPSSRALLPAIFGGRELREVPKELYAYQSAAPPTLAEPLVDGLRFVPIDAGLLARTDIAGVSEVIDEVRQMWPVPERFAERGLGVAGLVGERLVCWCTSEYVSAAMCGIGIATEPAYERRGIATAAAARFVAAALARGMTPYWECRAENIASARVAQKVGFTLLEHGSVWATLL
jgi:hypothetical protein